MKSNKKSKCIVLLSVIVVQLFIFPLMTLLSDGFLEYDQDNHNNLNLSANVNYIHIDGSDPDNWTQTEQKYDWCTGKGTWDTPFIIKNADLTGNYEGCSILIENSKKDYFRIEMSTISTSSYGDQYAGIKFSNTCNGTIINNTISNNLGNGIILETGCKNNTIFNNTIYGNQFSGIYLNIYSDQNTILNNSIINNGDYGIRLEDDCQSNIIRENSIKDNGDLFDSYPSGIYFYDSCSHNNIILNTIQDNYQVGIMLRRECSNNKIINNHISGSHDEGIYLRWGNNNNNITQNEIIECTDKGIYSQYHYQENVDNIIYNNSFTNPNGVNAEEDCSNNQWDYKELGNLWQDYISEGGYDLDDNGFGDVAYSISGSANAHDNFPICNDGHNGSVIKIDAIATGVNAYNWSWAKTRSWCTGTGSETDPYVIETPNITNAKENNYGILIDNSQVHFKIQNGQVSNASSEGAGIIIRNSIKGQIINVNVSNNDGIGILLDPSNFTTISTCFIYNNSRHGILITDECSNNTIEHNTIFNNTADGIQLYNGCKNHTISKNTITGNKIGISLNITCQNNTIHSNLLKNNTYGVWFYDTCQSNTFKNNSIIGNEKWGVNITTSECKYNSLYMNNFSFNPINANDNGTLNKWNDTQIGNYWHDYTGKDRNDDEIGEAPYNITGSAHSKDYLPIWSDEDDLIPKLTVNIPFNGTYWNAPKSINVSVIDKHLDTIWYNATGVEGITIITPFNNTDVPFNQTLWNKLPEGEFNVSFYANDTNENLNNTIKITLFKDSLKPNISIKSPSNGYVVGNYSPSFTINSSDKNLVAIWYTVDGGLTNYTLEDDCTPKIQIDSNINETAWANLLNGSFFLKVYANDTAGNVNSTEILIHKHITPGVFIIDTNVTSTVNNGYYMINWSFSRNAKNYTIYESESYITDVNDPGVYEVDDVLNTESRNFNFTKNFNRDFYYIVISFNNTGNFSTQCLRIRVIIPAEPFDLTHNADPIDSDGKFNLTWQASPQADNYSIYYHTSFITEINESVENIREYYTGGLLYPVSLDKVGMFYFVIVAHNETENVFSNNVKITIGLTPGSFILSTTADDPDVDGEFYLEWTSSLKATSYWIYYSTSRITEIDASVKLLAVTTGNSYFIKGLDEDVYDFIVVASNAYKSRQSNVITIDVDETPPPQAFTLSTDAGFPDPDGNFTLSWTKSQYAITYSVYVKDVTKTNYTIYLIASNLDNSTLSHKILNYTNGKYYFYVVAYNSYGQKESNKIYMDVRISEDEMSTDGTEPEIAFDIADLGYPTFITLSSVLVGTGLFFFLKKKRR